ncbi:MAG: DMT family transporter [Lautropia sp.]
MSERRPIDATGAGLMFLLCLAWSCQQIVLKATSQEMAPVLQIAVRSGGAALLVGLLMRWRGEPLNLADGTWRPGLFCGLLFAIEFLLAGVGLQFTHAAHLIVFLYTAPIFAALGLHLLGTERLATLQWLGIAIAFAGIAVAFLGSGAAPTGNAAPGPGTLFGDALALLAGCAWGSTTVVVRHTSLARLSATRTLLYQLVTSSVLLFGAAVAIGQTAIDPTPRLLAGLGFQTVIVTFASFLAWFWLLRRYLAFQLGVFSFITPMLGVVLGVLLLDEPLEPGFVGGATLLVAGIVLVSGHAWLKQRTARPG